MSFLNLNHSFYINTSILCHKLNRMHFGICFQLYIFLLTKEYKIGSHQSLVFKILLIKKFKDNILKRSLSTNRFPMNKFDIAVPQSANKKTHVLLLSYREKRLLSQRVGNSLCKVKNQALRLMDHMD